MVSTLKSIGAALAGILTGALLAVATDEILHATGVLPRENLYVAAWLIWVVLAYRTVYTILGCYVTAKLAPKNPMAHAVAVGLLGVVAAAAGAYATRNMNLGPQWYAWTLAALTIPTGWIGGWLAKR
jgi:hypothetical protein